jgi:hypothetical protein
MKSSNLGAFAPLREILLIRFGFFFPPRRQGAKFIDQPVPEKHFDFTLAPLRLCGKIFFSEFVVADICAVKDFPKPSPDLLRL